MKRRSFLQGSVGAVAGAALAACGESNGSPAVAVASKLAAGAPKVSIGFYGDSTTAGAQTLNGRLYYTAANEPAMVQTALQQWFNRTDIICNNYGIGGTEAAQLVLGIGPYTKTFAQMMATSTDQIVVINFLLNDSYYYANPQPGIPACSPNDYWGYMEQLCTIARSYGKVVVFQEPNPVLGVDPVNNPNAPIYAYVYNLRQMAIKNNAPLVPQFDAFQNLPGWLNWLSEDGTHPKDEAYAWKAWNTFSNIFQLVASKL